MKKRTIAIVAGGDSSELPVSLRSAQGIYSFIDKERYNLYIVEMQGNRWEVVLPNGEKTPIDRNDFSFTENGEKKVSSFQALMISTASRVGTGNIAGIATAIAAGGPGAVFWMWIMAVIGGASAFIESTLAQIYKVKEG